MSGLQHVLTFSGVGGIDRAFELAGVPTVATAEFDKHARGVIADRYPHARQFHDVKDVTADALYGLGLDPRRTVLSGGFPCQDLSVAGARRGLGEGTRSGLYWELDRIMGEFRPAWVVFENVPGLLSAACACPGDGTCVERDLARECDGDTHSVAGGACWGECIARHGGVMGAVLGSMAQRGYGFAYRVLDAQHFGVPQRRRRVVIVGRLGDSGSGPGQVLLEPEGVPGNPAEGIAPRKITAGGSRTGTEASGVLGRVAHTLTAEGHDASEDGTGRGTPVVTYAPDRAATLTAGTSRPGVSAPGRRQEDDVNVVATFQKVIRSGARDADGNLPPEVWERRDVAATLNLNDLGSEGRAVDLATGGATVRRLTPTECERLQGFPDGHTLTSNGTPQSDAQRYKQMGNAVAVPVFEWVARRLVAVDASTASERVA